MTYNWEQLEFEKMLLTKHYTKGRGGARVAFVVAHHMTVVGNGNGDALRKCREIWQTRPASAHYGVDGTRVAQFVWDSDYAWATGSSDGNSRGISIEHANSASAPTWAIGEATFKTGAKLVAYLHKKFKLGRPVKDKTIRKHSSFKSTACPGPYMDKNWDRYVKEAQRVYDEITSAPKPPKPPTPPTETTFVWYTVKSGDTVSAIAERNKTTVAQLQKWNPRKLKDPNRIEVGLKLKVGVRPKARPGTQK